MRKIDYSDIKPADILYFSSPGGHLDQLLIVIRGVDTSSLLVTDGNVAISDKDDIRYFVLTERKRWLIWLNFVRCLLIYLKCSPRLVISTGSGQALFFFIFARFSGAKTMYIESISRVRTLSLTGYIVRFIVHKFYAQSEDLTRYWGVEYAGILSDEY